MGRYPDFFYDDEACDPCEGCGDYVNGDCISDGACSASIVPQDVVEELQKKFGVTVK